MVRLDQNYAESYEKHSVVHAGRSPMPKFACETVSPITSSSTAVSRTHGSRAILSSIDDT